MRLLSERDPLYREADIIFQSRDVPHDCAVEELLSMIEAYLAAKNKAKNLNEDQNTGWPSAASEGRT
jgi:shikimate kinase